MGTEFLSQDEKLWRRVAETAESNVSVFHSTELYTYK